MVYKRDKIRSLQEEWKLCHELPLLPEKNNKAEFCDTLSFCLLEAVESDFDWKILGFICHQQHQQWACMQGITVSAAVVIEFHVYYLLGSGRNCC